MSSFGRDQVDLWVESIGERGRRSVDRVRWGAPDTESKTRRQDRTNGPSYGRVSGRGVNGLEEGEGEDSRGTQRHTDTDVDRTETVISANLTSVTGRVSDPLRVTSVTRH